MSALQPYVDGNVVPASQLIQRDPVFAGRTADSAAVNNSTVLVNDPVLFWALQANAVYDIRMAILYTSNATANLKWAFTFPAGCRLDFGFSGLLLGGVNAVDTRAAINLGSGVTIQTAGGTAPEALHINGTIRVGATPGNLQFQFAQNTANASNTVINAGSSGTLRQVA